jgi:hypothetical protein
VHRSWLSARLDGEGGRRVLIGTEGVDKIRVKPGVTVEPPSDVGAGLDFAQEMA